MREVIVEFIQGEADVFQHLSALIADGNYSMSLSVIHQIKGVSQTICATELSAGLVALEKRVKTLKDRLNLDDLDLILSFKKSKIAFSRIAGAVTTLESGEDKRAGSAKSKQALSPSMVEMMEDLGRRSFQAWSCMINTWPKPVMFFVSAVDV